MSVQRIPNPGCGREHPSPAPGCTNCLDSQVKLPSPWWDLHLQWRQQGSPWKPDSPWRGTEGWLEDFRTWRASGKGKFWGMKTPFIGHSCLPTSQFKIQGLAEQHCSFSDFATLRSKQGPSSALYRGGNRSLKKLKVTERHSRARARPRPLPSTHVCLLSWSQELS